MQTINFPRGHGILKAYMGLRPRDPDTLAYEALLKDAYGEAKTEEYLSRSIHHVLVYPYLSVQSPLQQLRCLRPVAADKTMSEIWHFRLKGAPEASRRTVARLSRPSRRGASIVAETTKRCRRSSKLRARSPRKSPTRSALEVFTTPSSIKRDSV